MFWSFLAVVQLLCRVSQKHHEIEGWRARFPGDLLPAGSHKVSVTVSAANDSGWSVSTHKTSEDADCQAAWLPRTDFNRNTMPLLAYSAGVNHAFAELPFSALILIPTPSGPVLSG